MKTIVLAISMALTVIGCSKEEPDNVAVASATPAPIAVTSVDSAPRSASSLASLVSIKVYKSPSCGCCKAWIEHLEQNGFKVEVVDMPDLSAVKTRYGVKTDLEACHTGVVGGYTVEGHVPADLIHKMLKDKPAFAGLAVPGMPMGSPGMEGASKERYNVLTFDRAGRTTVYAQR